MCHIPCNSCFEKAKKGMTVYKVAVEKDYIPFCFADPTDFRLNGSVVQPIFSGFSKNAKKYYSPFVGTEIKIGTLMADNNYFVYDSDYDEEISYGYFHFFETIKDARKFLNKHFKKCNFNNGSRPCILVGTIPEGEFYNKGVFHLNGDDFKSVIAKAVIYSGEMYYE